ncbi:MAG: serine dehydratase subunit alpha family protein [Lachnospiraceae bacterium]|nr:serine dehydratase subunit alpha family protein [Lachnospiraceae bacterium]
MERNDTVYSSYLRILEEELKTAMGCTEPIAIAYGAAKARALLGQIPERLLVQVSGNIIKNVKSVVVPHTGGLRGIPAAAAAGAAVGEAERELEVLSYVTKEQQAQIRDFLERVPITVEFASTPQIFDIMITAYAGEHEAFVRIAEYHTNLVCLRKDGETLLEKELRELEEDLTDRSLLSIEGIIEFGERLDIRDAEEILKRQISLNMAIAEEGLKGDYGARIGKTLLQTRQNALCVKMRAWAAAASDARMNGCELPVVINSGSGNQGITASVPLVVYAREKGYSEEELLRALAVSNLVTIHLKTGIGRLSAYCGVVSAGCGCAAGLAFLKGGRFDAVAHTVVNSLAMNSGVICDGAKASCAAKIASAVEAGLLGLDMYEKGNQFFGGDGIVKKGVENTIRSVGHLARFGMAETDQVIIRLMLEE